MKWLMRKCSRCGRYTLATDKCPYCGGELRVPHPPRASPDDKLVVYRLQAKLESGLLKLDEKPPYVP
ncbi:Nucleolar RNA-binding protein Nop10p [Thermogladius calderae 1633]|uniref:Ribosome biogenesis protein Nop10 n=1 Tax=Thermogladius calderae (strain DSM 22663 / VKM B-2946 / 1633) TaxID=1184251 RepID=I3TDQ0_THEC1|nr:RNA-protein complex protein Nop10 [Thermogladius calderae]AFK50888.1 Nucleolar RNA-binding protein Nop10p [Thermogladius calderae 1633]